MSKEKKNLGNVNILICTKCLWNNEKVCIHNVEKCMVKSNLNQQKYPNVRLLISNAIFLKTMQ